jgi:hypothetical protein
MKKNGPENEGRAEQQLEPIEIGFGDVFIYADDATKRYVITEIGEKNFCSAAGIFEVDGKEALGISGTTLRKDIASIAGSWDLPRILQAHMIFFGDDEASGRIYDLLRESSTLGRRLLTE